MTGINCGCNTSCTGLAVVASIILGIVAAFLRITAVITLTPAFLWVALGISVVYLAVALLSASDTEQGASCRCPALNALLAGILGTALLSVILLGITFAATSFLGAVLTGALILFLSLIITATACLVKCKSGCN